MWARNCDVLGQGDLYSRAATASDLEDGRATTPAAERTGQPAPSSVASPDASAEHPSESDLAALRNLALTECREDEEAFADRIRRMAKLPKQASVSPRLLTKTLPMHVYAELYAYYQRLSSQQQRPTTAEVPRANPTPTISASEPTPAPAVGTPAAVPSNGSSSAASDPAAEAAEWDRARLRKELASWGPLRVNAAEVEHILTHHPYSKARTLLWKCRQQPSQAEALVAD